MILLGWCKYKIYNKTAISNDISIFIPVGSFTLEDFYYVQYVYEIPVAGGITEDILDDNPYHLSLDIWWAWPFQNTSDNTKKHPLEIFNFRDGSLKMTLITWFLWWYRYMMIHPNELLLVRCVIKYEKSILNCWKLFQHYFYKKLIKFVSSSVIITSSCIADIH